MHDIDPKFLPETSGTLERFLPNHHGELDGLLLREGLEVHFPPHLGRAVEALASSGDIVRIRGVRPRNAEVIAAVRIENARGEVVLDEGPPKGRPPPRERDSEPHVAKPHRRSVEGTVVRALHGPKGDAHGALLDDGTILRWPPHEGHALAALLTKGTAVAARGDARSTSHGDVVEVHAIGPSATALRTLEKKKPHKHERPHERPSRPH